MRTPNPQQMESAKRLLASEILTALNVPAAAAQMYEKVLEQLARLVGAAGVQALFSRSLKLTKLEYPCLDGLTVAATPTPGLARLATQLRDCLQSQEPELAVAAAEALFGNFFSLLAAVIGDRLTEQVLHGAWPETPGPSKRQK